MTLAEIQTKLAALKTSVDAEGTVEASILTLLTGLTSTVADLKTQLAAAIASNDPVALQAVADGLDALQSEVDSNAASLSAAVTANTPSA